MEDYQVYSIIPKSEQIVAQYKQQPEHFCVTEVPLYLPSGEGQHLYLTIERQELNTDDVVKELSKSFSIPSQSIGYAGKKDRNAITIQTFSLDLGRNYQTESAISLINEKLPHLKLINVSRHTNKIKLGHLKGNQFKIVLCTDDSKALDKISQSLVELGKTGVPNFFGDQRFGQKGDNHIKGRKLLLGKINKRNRTHKFLLSALQSYLFNKWLKQRIEDHLFSKTIEGDHINGAGIVTGPIFGSKMVATSNLAQQRETEVLEGESLNIDHFSRLLGSRRALSFKPSELTHESCPEGVQISFFLPKGCYATALLDQLVRKD